MATAMKVFVGTVLEIHCPVCSWTASTTDPDLIDTLCMDATDHARECVAHGSQW